MTAVRCLTTLALAGGLTACGDDPNSPGIKDVLLAARLEGVALAHGGEVSATAARGAAHALRLGVRPAEVNITVDGVTERYFAFAAEYAFGDDADGGPLRPLPTIHRTIIAWRGMQPDRVIAINVPGDTGTFADPCATALCLMESAGLLASPRAIGIVAERGRWSANAAAGGARTTRESLGSECPVPERPVFLPLFEPVSCHRAVFFARFTLTANERGVTAPGPLHVVQMNGHDVPGVRILYPPLPTL
jgi:hypothetical protein